MIEVRNVTRTYGKRGSTFQALRGVDFTIPSGATAAIIGKSGSGKSTLMHIMGGLDRPTSGEILVDGTSLGELKRRAMDTFRARDLGFVFQSFFIEANQTCYQNIVLPLEVNNVPHRRRRQLAEKALEQVELFDKANAKAGTLSGGQKQRLAIARAIVHRPRIILADEPTGNLDSATGDKVVNLLFGLNRRLQCTLIIVTHDEELAARCQYQITIKDGQVVAVRGPKPDAKATTTTRPQPSMTQTAKPTPMAAMQSMPKPQAIKPPSAIAPTPAPKPAVAPAPAVTPPKPPAAKQMDMVAKPHRPKPKPETMQPKASAPSAPPTVKAAKPTAKKPSLGGRTIQ